jgi:2-haloacid dehalogenase
MSLRAVILDIGNVVIRWRPEMLFPTPFESQAALDATLLEHNFREWYDNGRGGTGTERAAIFDTYMTAFAAAVSQPMPGMATMIDRLKAKGITLLALSNAPPEAEDLVRAAHGPAMECFRDVFISGKEGIAKPDTRAFQMILQRNAIQPGDAIFADDMAENVAAAEAAGLKAHLFTTAADFERRLFAEGVL